MKNIFSATVALLLVISSYAQNVGTNFQNITFEEALSKAKAENKMVFIDAYTAWCGPCKFMAKEILTQEKLGNYLNEHFICVKFDMEKGQGIELARKYNVNAYPTFLLLNNDGTIQHSVVGGATTADEFQDIIEKGLVSENSFGGMTKKYKAGVRDEQFVLEYIKLLADLRDNNVFAVTEELIKKADDEKKVSIPYWFIYDSYLLSPEGTENYKYLANNIERFKKSVGVEPVRQKLLGGNEIFMVNILVGRDRKSGLSDVAKMEKHVSEIPIDGKENFNILTEMAKAKLSNNNEKLLKLCEKNMALLPDLIQVNMFPAIAMTIKKEASKKQMSRLTKVAEGVLAQTKLDRYKQGLESLIKVGLKL